MSDYALTGNDAVLRNADGVYIPDNPANRDRAAYEAWLAAGGVPDPYVAPPAPVPTITKAQALLYLLSIGKTEADVEAVIATIADANARAVAQIEWDYRQPFHADHPLFVQLGPAIGITDMVAAFTAAAQL